MEAKKFIKDYFKSRNMKINLSGVTNKAPHKKSTKPSRYTCLPESDSEDELKTQTLAGDAGVEQWEVELNSYLKTSTERLGEQQGLVQWWGIYASCFGSTWTAIARDLLPVMVLSVSSERAFSSAGITITKHWNQLHGNVVKALQVLKIAFWREEENILHQMMPSLTLEEEEEELECAEATQMAQVDKPKVDDGYKLVFDLHSDCEESDTDMDNVPS
ncbi:hypothetical protein PM082_015006 [Marasmius tenuissimus]|nr:hypothetical protein PM082_015006 [Marasmius tenuissimus]